MATQTTKVRNGTIILPKKFRKRWEEAEVFIDISDDLISIKRLTKPALSLKEMMDQFSQAARKTGLSKKSVEKIIRNVKQEMYHASSNRH